ncbi:hypothetical protein QP162_01895 [Sphingomonas aurantiaca]|uniref:hypothetical protein n=1 Tax=Sphingomonas aurantiaca TaxID=185949 RepID=UPI002FE02BB7
MHDPKFSRVVPLMLAAALAGCTVGPNFTRPAAILPPVWRAAAAAQPPSDTRWWRSFGDPVLDLA